MRFGGKPFPLATEGTNTDFALNPLSFRFKAIWLKPLLSTQTVCHFALNQTEGVSTAAARQVFRWSMLCLFVLLSISSRLCRYLRQGQR
jgi:hypothetical protein